MKFYTCWSINLLRFIKAHGKKPLSKYIHPKSNRTGWIFSLDDELSNILTTFSTMERIKK